MAGEDTNAAAAQEVEETLEEKKNVKFDKEINEALDQLDEELGQME